MEKLNETDLRIGNFVTWKDEENPENAILTITGINLNGDIHVEWEWEDGTIDNTDCQLKDISPIPLTDKWVKDFGLNAHKTYDKFFLADDNIAISTADGKFRFMMGNFVCQLMIREIEFVHELQNLFFEIKRQELELK